jgi:Secretion system C-terminal sorting domain/von Willebrand factor type A domain
MKSLLTSIWLVLVGLTGWSSLPDSTPAHVVAQNGPVLTGFIIHRTADQKIANAKVTVRVAGRDVASTQTDTTGAYTIILPENVKLADVTVFAAGYESRTIMKVPFESPDTVRMQIPLQSALFDNQWAQCDWKAGAFDAYHREHMRRSAYHAHSADDAEMPAPAMFSAPPKVIEDRVPPPPPTDEDVKLGEAVVVGYGVTTKKRSDSSTAGEKKSTAAPTPKMKAAAPASSAPGTLTPASTASPKPVPVTKPAEPAPRAGLLTAGEWNDLHNWSKHWTDLITDGEINPFQSQYECYPRHRYTVMLSNLQDVPLVDWPVRLAGKDGTIYWEARTDNTGKAELWFGLNTKDAKPSVLHLETTINDKKSDLGGVQPYDVAGIEQYKIDQPCAAPRVVDIMWVVDATGSMGDEIQYLKTEVLDVIGRVQATQPDLQFRMGSVFYRDHGDDYVVKSSGLHSDLNRTVDYIRQQYAGGGGDYPEAVEEALTAAIVHQQWSQTAVARICFVVLDASPHQSPEINRQLALVQAEAARKGIRIVPITASGIQKDTEFLMKFMGLATNGTYVFLTDHSGIGGKHLAPTSDTYKVEPLNQLLVRLITEYVTVETCEGQSLVRFESDPQQQQQPIQPVRYFPNPASTKLTVDLPFDAQKVTLYDAEGSAVLNVERPNAGQHTLSVKKLPPGFYTLRIWHGDQVQSGKVLVIR